MKGRIALFESMEGNAKLGERNALLAQPPANIDVDLGKDLRDPDGRMDLPGAV